MVIYTNIPFKRIPDNCFEHFETHIVLAL